jgi:hypothetical protein
MLGMPPAVFAPKGKDWSDDIYAEITYARLITLLLLTMLAFTG